MFWRMKAFILPTLACDMDCPGCFLTSTTRARPTALDPSSLETLLQELPRGSSVVVAGGEMSVMDPKEARTLIRTIVQTRPDIEVDLSLNLMQFPDWLADICRSYFGARVETSFAWAGRHRAGQTPREWRKEFLAALRSVAGKGITVEVFVEVERALITEGADALLGFMDLVEAPDRVQWAMGPSVDTNRIIAEGLDPGHGAPLRITHEEWETFCLFVGVRLAARSYRSRPWISPVSEILDAGSRARKDGKMGDVSRDICVSLLADGSLRTNILYAEAQTLMRHIAPGWSQQLAGNRLVQDAISFQEARLRECDDCAFAKNCDRGLVLAVPRSLDQKACLGLSRLRKMVAARNGPAQARPSR